MALSRASHWDGARLEFHRMAPMAQVSSDLLQGVLPVTMTTLGDGSLGAGQREPVLPGDVTAQIAGAAERPVGRNPLRYQYV